MFLLSEIKSDDSGKAKPADKHLTEADDVLNVDCTEEIDEFTNFLNEFEDELKEKPKKDKSSSSSNNKSKVICLYLKVICLYFKGRFLSTTKLNLFIF